MTTPSKQQSFPEDVFFGNESVGKILSINAKTRIFCRNPDHLLRNDDQGKLAKITAPQ
ncbi:MAG: hypothetical protein GY899_05315 [Verrucomicrobiaceae bacterium]|nr:hypothetical protein [Verrucomicrobiaceae bacterium]